MLLPKPFILISRIHAKEQNEHCLVPQYNEDELKYAKLDEEPAQNSDDEEEGKRENHKIQNDEPPTDKGDKKNEKKAAKKEENKEDNRKTNNKADSSDSSIEFHRKRDQLSSENEESHSESEIFIHQLIETIEFVLGTISNTASYLRLWALSLAHSQLAEVFFELVLWSGVKAQSPILIFIGFAIFASASFAVLMCMDLMECFLHTLRLHWVEFQNKFYKGTGKLFKPLNFVSISEPSS